MSKEAKWRVLALLVGLALGFFISRQQTEVKEIIKYEQGETIVSNYPRHLLLPQLEIKPKSLVWPYFVLREVVVSKDSVILVPDTAVLIDDYFTRRQYSLTLFDNEYGKLQIAPEVQFNRLDTLPWSFEPIQKVITRAARPTVDLYISGGLNSFNQSNIGGGLFYNNFGLEYDFIIDLSDGQKGHAVSVKYRF